MWSKKKKKSCLGSCILTHISNITLPPPCLDVVNSLIKKVAFLSKYDEKVQLCVNLMSKIFKDDICKCIFLFCLDYSFYILSPESPPSFCTSLPSLSWISWVKWSLQLFWIVSGLFWSVRLPRWMHSNFFPFLSLFKNSAAREVIRCS